MRGVKVRVKPRKVFKQVIVLPLMLAVLACCLESIRLSANRLPLSSTVLVDFGVEVVATSNWFLPIIAGLILTAYVGLLSLNQTHTDEGDVARAQDVLPWLCMVAAMAAVTWTVFGTPALWRPGHAATWIAGLVVALLAAGLASQVGPLTTRKLPGRIDSRRAEIQSLDREISRLAGSTPPSRRGAFTVLCLWYIGAVALPVVSYVCAIGPTVVTSGEWRTVTGVIGASALILSFVGFGAALSRPPHVVAVAEILMGAVLYLLGLFGYVAVAMMFYVQAPELRSPRFVTVSVMFASVALVVAFVTFPGIARRMPWLRRWTPDSAIDGVYRARFRRLIVESRGELRRLEKLRRAELENTPRAGGLRRILSLLRRRR